MRPAPARRQRRRKRNAVWILRGIAPKLRANAKSLVARSAQHASFFSPARACSLLRAGRGIRSRSSTCRLRRVGVLLLGLGIYWMILAADLSAQAEAYDLAKLEQMESASVILDRNEKMFGQIYVENRETIPYDQLPRDLINAVVAVEDTKFYTHGGYDLFGILRAALKNFTAGGVRQGASTITQQLARNTFALQGSDVPPQAGGDLPRAPDRGAVRQAEDHGALSEPDLLRRRSLRRGSGVARLFRQTGARHDADGSRHAGGLDQEPEPALAVDRQSRIARGAQPGARADARSWIHHRGRKRRRRRRKRSSSAAGKARKGRPTRSTKFASR